MENRPGSSSAHQRCCIAVVTQSNRMPQLVGDNIACETGPGRKFPKAWDCDEDFSERRPRECEWIETVTVGQNDDHIAVGFPHAVPDRGQKGPSLQRNEVAGRNRSEAVHDGAETERAAELREFGVPEVDGLAYRRYSEIVFGRYDDDGGDFLPHHPPRGGARYRLRMRGRREASGHASQA